MEERAGGRVGEAAGFSVATRVGVGALSAGVVTGVSVGCARTTSDGPGDAAPQATASVTRKAIISLRPIRRIIWIYYSQQS